MHLIISNNTLELFYLVAMNLNRLRKFILSAILSVSLVQAAYSQEKTYLYYTDAVYQRILRVGQDGDDFEEIVTDGLGFPWRIAIDEKGGKIYWTNVDYNLVQRANVDGSEVENLLVVTYPQGIITVDKKLLMTGAPFGHEGVFCF